MKNLISNKFIAALLVSLLLTATASAGVTNIKEVVNNTSEAITISKGTVIESWNKDRGANETRFSSKETTGEILKNGTWSGDMWIPWVANQEDFKNNVIEIRIYDEFGRTPNQNRTFLLWQSGDFVRLVIPFNNILYRFVPNAPKISGEAKVDGERRLVINKVDDKYQIRIEKF
jgi:hypothetical protein